MLIAARSRSGLSKRMLARLAKTSAPALVEYEHHRRSPTVATLERVLAAAGLRCVPDLRPQPVDVASSARRLEQVLELAEALPRRPSPPLLDFPPFGVGAQHRIRRSIGGSS